MKRYIYLLCVLLFLFCSSLANAAQITFDSVTGTGTYNNSVELLTDGVFPSEGGQWQTNTVWWNGTGPFFTFDMGEIYDLEDIILSVDNNDWYQVDYSVNGSDWNMLFSIARSYGEINWGMDTMATLIEHDEYISQIDFTSPVDAQFLRIYATGGDNSYSIGEFQAFGEVSPVPEPATMLLFGSGLVGLTGLRRKFRKK
jgi:hypothetical protein